MYFWQVTLWAWVLAFVDLQSIWLHSGFPVRVDSNLIECHCLKMLTRVKYTAKLESLVAVEAVV